MDCSMGQYMGEFEKKLREPDPRTVTVKGEDSFMRVDSRKYEEFKRVMSKQSRCEFPPAPGRGRRGGGGGCGRGAPGQGRQQRGKEGYAANLTCIRTFHP